MDRIQYEGDTGGTGPSPAIWKPEFYDRTKYYGHYEDWMSVATGASTQIHNGWYVFKDSNATIKGTAKRGGEVALFGTTDNDECNMSYGELLSAPFVISDTAGDDAPLYFETRIKRSVITDAKGGFFVGLADEAAAANEFMVDAGDDFGDDDFIGFWCDETDDSIGSHVHFIYQITGSGTTGFNLLIDTVATMEADTYMKLGFVFDPLFPAAKRIKIYVDGVEQTTYVTATQIAVNTGIQDGFPDAEGLQLMLALKNAHEDDFTVTDEWIYAFQQRA